MNELKKAGNLVNFFVSTVPSARFAFCLLKIEIIVKDKDSEKTKKSTKVAKQVFFQYSSENKLAEPNEPSNLAKSLSSFYVEARRKDARLILYLNE